MGEVVGRLQRKMILLTLSANHDRFMKGGKDNTNITGSMLLFCSGL